MRNIVINPEELPLRPASIAVSLRQLEHQSCPTIAALAAKNSLFAEACWLQSVKADQARLDLV